MVKKICLFVAVISFAVALTGCSAFRSHSQTVNVSCIPEDAVVMVNGTRVATPARMRVKRDSNLYIQAEKEGFTTYRRTVGHHLNATGVLDMIGTCLWIVPCAGLCTSGAYSLDETDIAITLFKK